MDDEQKKPGKVWPYIAGGCGCVILLIGGAALAVVVALAMVGDNLADTFEGVATDIEAPSP